MVQRTATRYAKSGSAHIAYQTIGDGPIDLVYVAGAITHLDALCRHLPGTDTRSDTLRRGSLRAQVRGLAVGRIDRRGIRARGGRTGGSLGNGSPRPDPGSRPVVAGIRCRRQIDVRAGVHTGECTVFDGKLGGIAVHTGARVAALAGPGDVLVSQTVRDLVSGSGVQLSERGRHTLKGVLGEWGVFAASA